MSLYDNFAAKNKCNKIKPTLNTKRRSFIDFLTIPKSCFFCPEVERAFFFWPNMAATKFPGGEGIEYNCTGNAYFKELLTNMSLPNPPGNLVNINLVCKFVIREVFSKKNHISIRFSL
jgi:hypothetical protein